MPKLTRKRAIRVVLVVVLMIVAGILRRPLFQGNFAVVEPDLVFRSAQPTSNLASLVETYKLESILNLRGGSLSESFYANEVRVAKERGVDFYDFPLRATHRPSRSELLALVDLFDRCRYPLLIHCKWGSDRTGLASGLYKLTRKGESPSSALGAFAIQHLHVPLFGPEKLQEPFKEYASWLESGHLAHRPDRFRHWLTTCYEPLEPARPAVVLQPGPRAQPTLSR